MQKNTGKKHLQADGFMFKFAYRIRLVDLNFATIQWTFFDTFDLAQMVYMLA